MLENNVKRGLFLQSTVARGCGNSLIVIKCFVKLQLLSSVSFFIRGMENFSMPRIKKEIERTRCLTSCCISTLSGDGHSR